MARFDSNEPIDPLSVASGGASDCTLTGSCSDGLGLLVWLGQLAREESTRRPSQFGIAESLDPPRSIGRFQLEILLGAGAYGAVFRALDAQLGRRVALKLAWPGVLMDPVASRRFIEEPKTVASLKHRGIVEVYDSGEIEMAAFIALELVDGPTLAQWLKEQEHVSPRLAAQIVRSVAEAVQFAHERGIVHRDLKPSNILLRPCKNGDAFGYEPVVTDFGLARRPRLSDMSNETGTQAIIGTDHYMSPEQAAARKDDVGPASDVFSLGVILYELIAGRRPFDGDSSEQIRRRIQQDQAPAIRPWRKTVPKDLETIALKCLEKSPDRRYASAQELADDLGRFLDDKPIRARPVGVIHRGWKYVKRRPLTVSLVSVVVTSVLAIAGLTGAWIADRMSAGRQIEAAEAATAISDGLERQQQYVANVRRAAEALHDGRRRELLEHLEKCRSLARAPVQCGIEWGWLWAKANDANVTLHAHPTGVKSVRFDPQGNRLVTAGKDGRIIVWDATTWTKQQELRYADDAEVTVTEFSTDGSLLAAGGEDGRVVVYRLADFAAIFDEQVIKGRVFDLVWIGSTQELAVGGEGAVLWMVDPVNGTLRSKALAISPESRAASPVHPDEIGGLAYVASRNAVAVFLAPATAHFVDPVSLEVQSPALIKSPATDRGYNLAPGYIATPEYNAIRIWNVKDGSTASELSERRQVQCMRYSNTARAIAVGFRNGGVEVFDYDDVLAGRKTSGRRFSAHMGRTVSVDISPDGTWLASGGWDGDVKLSRRHSVSDPFDVSLPGMPFHIEFSPCGRWLSIGVRVAERAGHLTVFEVRTGKRLWSMNCLPRPGNPPDPPLFMYRPLSKFDPSGDEILVVDVDRSIQALDARTGRVMKSYSAPSVPPIDGILLAADRRSLIVLRPGSDTLVMDRTSGTLIGQTAWCYGMFHTVRGDLWLNCDESRNLALRASPADATLLSLPGLVDRPEVAAISPDGRYLAVGGIDRIVYFWELARGGLPSKCVGHDDTIRGLRFSPDGRTIISRSEDGTVRFWDVATQSQLLVLGSPDTIIWSMDVSPKGDLLVCGVQHRFKGHAGLQIYRLGPSRDTLPKCFDTATAQP